jgi:Tfp pilus assembly protein PilF
MTLKRSVTTQKKEIVMRRKTIILVSSLFVCTASVALAQTSHAPKSSNVGPPQNWDTNPMPLSPRERAESDRRNALDTDAAADLDAGQYAEAEDEARESLSHGLGNGEAEELLAHALNAQGKTPEALRAYGVIAHEGSEEPRILLPYALLLLKTGHWAQAVFAYNKQLPYLAENKLMVANSHFSPEVPQPRQLATAIHLALGSTYAASMSWGRHSQDDKALAEFRQALALTPDSALAYLYYGRQLKHMGHRAEAQAAYTKAADLGDGDVKAAAETALRQRQ